MGFDRVWWNGFRSEQKAALDANLEIQAKAKAKETDLLALASDVDDAVPELDDGA